jgi:UV excision repair protein RAD23
MPIPAPVQNLPAVVPNVAGAGTQVPVNVPQPGAAPQVRPAVVSAQVAPVPPPVAPEAKKPISSEERFVVGDEYEKSIAGLMEMGFQRDQVIKALKAAYNNPERAADYLINVLRCIFE